MDGLGSISQKASDAMKELREKQVLSDAEGGPKKEGPTGSASIADKGSQIISNLKNKEQQADKDISSALQDAKNAVLKKQSDG